MKKLFVLLAIGLALVIVVAALNDPRNSAVGASSSSYDGDGSDASIVRFSAEKTLREKCATLQDFSKNELECNTAKYMLKNF